MRIAAANAGPATALPAGTAESVFARFRWASLVTLRAIVSTVLMLSLARLAMYLVYRMPEPVPVGDLLDAFVTGLRFDMKVGATLSLPLLALFAIPSERWARIAAAVFLIPVFAVLDFVSIGNHYFYGYYATPVSPMAFGLLEDDTSAVLASMWSEYPIVRALLLLAAIALAQVWWSIRIRRRAIPWRYAAKAGWVVGVVLVLAVLTRGSFGTFPLRQQHMTVSGIQFVNDLVPNGPIALYYAYGDRAATDLGRDPLAVLRRHGFRGPVEAARAMGLTVETEADVIAQLYPETPENSYAETNRPHVVLALMEAWGLYPLLFHGPGNNLLGRLEPHLAHSVLFTNFVSGVNGSFAALEAVLLGSPISPLTQTRYGYQPYASSIAHPFNGKGYRTVFVTSCSGTWRNVKAAFKRQGFREVYDMTDIRKAFPEAAFYTWGVDDEYLFRFAYKLLSEADRAGEHLFLAMLSGGNHPPYRTPPGYRVLPLQPERIPNCEGAVARASLETYQYALDSLGSFLDDLDASGLAGHTIVAATGDHGHRGFSPPTSDAALPLRFGVPFLLVAPSEYLKGRTVDASRYASQRDLAPTLCHLALSRAKYFASGRDLFAASPEAPDAGPYSHPFRGLTCYRSVLSERFLIPDIASGFILTREPDGRVTPATDAVRNALQSVVREERAYAALMDWNIRRQALAVGK